MAKNTGNNRVKIKWVRDGIKSQYPKGTRCEVCDTEEDLEFHHYHTLSLVFDEFCKKHGYKIVTDEDVLAVRDQFYEEYWNEVVTDGVTLCNSHHKELHVLYGKQPALSTAQKQKVWVKRIREKLAGKDSSPTTTKQGRFSKFIESSECNRFSKLLLGD